MKVLWLAAQGLPEMLKKLTSETVIPPTGGWLIGASQQLKKRENIELGYCFPHVNFPKCFTVDGITCYTVRRILDHDVYTGEDLENLRSILNKFQPDVIQIFGTEHTQQTSWIQMLKKLDVIHKTVIWIQGMVYWYAKRYDSGMSEQQVKGRTIKEYIKRNNISDMKHRMILQGEKEYEALKIAKHVSVRTDWDEAGCKAINPKLKVHHCNETLRPEFYKGEKWDINQIKKYCIFVSQSNYPIKGFHKLLEALVIVKERYPDTEVYTTGWDYIHNLSIKDTIRLSNYQRIIRKYVKDHNLAKSIHFCGTLNAQQMKENYLKAHIFVSPSSIENSPNSLGEAMMCGTPCITSDVGGVKTMLVHNKEGFVYPFEETYVLAEYICRIFENGELACEFSMAAKKHAMITHDSQKNCDQLIENYQNIMRGNC